MLKILLSKIFHRLGYTVVPEWKMEDLPLEQHLARLLQRYEIRTVFDIGANSGQYRDFLRHRIGFSGTIHSFEPNPALVEVLKQRASGDADWHIHPIGIGSTSGSLELNIMARDTFSSFRIPDRAQSEKFSTSNVIERTVSVPVKTLDEVCAELDLGKLGNYYVKIDTKGFDVEVVRGAPQTLRDARAMQFELPIQRLYQGVPHYRELLAEVEALGFELSGMFAISYDDALRAVEFDCVLVKPSR